MWRPTDDPDLVSRHPDHPQQLRSRPSVPDLRSRPSFKPGREREGGDLEKERKRERERERERESEIERRIVRIRLSARPPVPDSYPGTFQSCSRPTRSAASGAAARQDFACCIQHQTVQMPRIECSRRSEPIDVQRPSTCPTESLSFSKGSTNHQGMQSQIATSTWQLSTRSAA